MKIPETSANVGAYYGNEENGQWQPNGVIIDSGVGGGVVGSGDAGIHRPPVYPVHMPRAQVPAGYVVAGAYFPGAPYAGVAPAPPDDFADYMWMEHEEEFDKQVMQQLEEEALMEQCIEAMLEDEQRERTTRSHNGHKHPTTSNGGPSLSLEETVSRSTLNPLAAEFVPTTVRQQPTEEDRAAPQDPPEAPAVEKEKEHPDGPPAPADSTPDNTQEVKTEEPTPPQKDPPEVSAADVQPIAEKAQDKRPKDPKKDSRPKQDPKKSVKSVDPKPKAKPQVVKSETKVQPKKKEVKSVKSEVKVEEKRTEVKEEKVEEVPVQSVAEEQPKAQTPPMEETASGPKPINYAAAARANKPKPPPAPPAPLAPPAPPAGDKPAPQPKAKPADKKDKKPDKPSVHRKNSAK